jgi:hypothetical protein
MENMPWFKFTPYKWEDGDIVSCSLPAQAFFIRICNYYWSKSGNVKIDKLKRKFAIYDKFDNSFSKALDELIKEEIIISKSGLLSICFLDEQINAHITLKSKRSEAGRKGGKKSKRKAKISNCLNLDKQNLSKNKQSRVEESRVDKNREDKEKIKNRKDIKHKHGEYKHVFLTEKEYRKLIDDFDVAEVNDMIKELDEGIEQYGYKYKNHNLTLRKWRKKNKSNNTLQKNQYGRNLTREDVAAILNRKEVNNGTGL